MAELADQSCTSITLAGSALQKLQILEQFLQTQLALHYGEAINRAREERGDATYMPPIPLHLMPFIQEIHKVIKSEADLESPQPKTQVANFFFDVNSYGKFKSSLSASARAELAKLEQKVLKEAPK